jgi:glycosyltransferase involved in cell wall biosynthesis
MENFQHIIITHGYHPPWTHGETVTTRNIILMLKEISKYRPMIYSSIDTSRFEGVILPDVFYIKLNNIRDYTVLIHILSQHFTEVKNEPVFLHLSGVKEHLVYLLGRLCNVYSKTLSMLIYDFGKGPGCHRIPRILKLTVDSYLGSVLTTSRHTHIQYGRYLRIHYMPPPIVPPDKLYAISPDAECNSKLIDDALYYIVYIGHLYEIRFPYKIVLKAIYKVIKSGFKDLKLLIITPKTMYNIEMSKIIEKYSDKLGIRRNIMVFSENLTEKCKYELLKRTNIFLFIPSRQPVTMDPPISVIEAMFSGNVVLSTRYMGLKYTIKDGINGVIVDNVSVDVLYEKLKNILSNDNLREYVSQNAKRYALKNHYYTNLIEVFKNILVVEGKLHG